MDGILNIRKEKGFTSHDVVAVVRRILHTKKVGHTGTLDPDAEGVLPVCVGKATKLADIIMDGKKRYRAMVRLGITTTTEDAAGEVLEEKPVDFDEEKSDRQSPDLWGNRNRFRPCIPLSRSTARNCMSWRGKAKKLSVRQEPLPFCYQYCPFSAS